MQRVILSIVSLLLMVPVSASSQAVIRAVGQCNITFFGEQCNPPRVGDQISVEAIASQPIDVGSTVFFAGTTSETTAPNGFMISLSGDLGSDPGNPSLGVCLPAQTNSGADGVIQGVLGAISTTYSSVGGETVTAEVSKCVPVLLSGGRTQLVQGGTLFSIQGTFDVLPQPGDGGGSSGTGGGSSQPPQPTLRLRIDDFVTGNEVGHVDFTANAASAPTQLIKLGQEIRVFIFPVQSDGTEGALLASSETMGDAQDQSPSDSQVFSDRRELFAGQVLVHFPLPDATSFQTQFHRFFPVHSGTVSLHFAFQNQGQSYAVTVPMQVSNCNSGDCKAKLGTLHPEFDDLLMKFADRNGVPPQLLKAQIQQESGFKPNAYRYEALSVDFAQIAAPLRRGRAFGLVRQRAFAPWALGEATDCTSLTEFISQGANLDLASADASPRQQYRLALLGAEPECRITFPDLTRPSRTIQPSDSLPSMENVFYTNDGVLVDWSRQASRNKARSDVRFWDYQLDHPPFTAQTVIASSYGLHQVMYQTAIGQGYIDNNGVGQSPGSLLAPSISLDLGTDYLARRFSKISGAGQQDYSEENEFLFQFAPALRAFNAGDGSESFDVNTAENTCLHGRITAKFLYACAILKNVPRFNPAF